MQTTSRFRLDSADLERATSQIVDEDGRILASVEGVVIEGQFQCTPGYLVVTSNANPFEEELHFYLLNDRLSLVDSVSLGQIYHSGIMRQLEIGPGDRLEFSFFGDERWRLTVLVSPRRRLSFPFSSVRYSGGALDRHALFLERLECSPI